MTTAAQPIPPGITPGPGYVGPTRDVEIKSLGVGAAPRTPGDVIASGYITAGSGLYAGSWVSSTRWITRTAVSTVLTLVSGTALEVTAVSDTILTVQLTATVAGHASMTVGPTTGAEHVIATDLLMVAGSSTVVTAKVPAEWKVIVTVVTVAISRAIAIR